MKNVIAILDNDFGSLRMIKNDNNVFINDVDLSISGKSLIKSLANHNCRLFLLIREKEQLGKDVYDQVKTILTYNLGKPNIIDVLPFDDYLGNILKRIQEDFSVNPNESIFISSDRSSRHISLNRGYRALPHPKAVNLIMEGKSLKFVRIVANKLFIDKLTSEDILPYYFEEIDDNNSCELLAIVSKVVVNQAIEHKIDIQILDVDLSYEDIVHVNIDNTFTKELIEETTSNYGFLLLDDNRMIITVREKKIANIPLHGVHGHFIQLIPDDTLLFKFRTAASINKNYLFKKTLDIIRNWPAESIKFKSLSDIFSTYMETKLDPVNPSSILNDIKRYSGEIGLDAMGKIVSRHCLHQDNARVVVSLERELKQMGYFVRVWEFQAESRPPGRAPDPEVEGATFYNVIAELPGIGANLLLEDDLSSKVRDILIQYANPLQDESWIYKIRTLLGDGWLEKNGLQSLSALDLKRRLEKLFGLEEWSSWWIKDKLKPGLGSEIVIIGCHLDSTASSSKFDGRNYIPAKDPAPGADDDGSGLAATLELARVFSKLKNKLTQTIQFCFFNAEEVGLRGSLEYAKYMRRINAPIAAVICMDMIGYNKDKSNRTFEIHVGHSNIKIRDNCLPLVQSLEETLNNLGKLENVQIYKGLSWGTGQIDEGNREKYDGAIRRSDHWSFQTHGYPAALLSEDFFINIPNVESKQDSNPHYHRITDKGVEVDQSYAGDIASIVAITVRRIAEI